MARALSKSRLIAYRQCPKRLWLEVHRADLAENGARGDSRVGTGREVGEIARSLYDPKKKGVLLNPSQEGYEAAFARTRELLESPQPIFEGGFRTEEALSFADVMLPVQKGGKRAWKLVEVKSSTSVKEHHLDDAAIQAAIARAAGVAFATTSIACIDGEWVYEGDGDYAGLLRETDVTAQVVAREPEVKKWIADAQRVVAREQAPEIRPGGHCTQPYACSFSPYCQGAVPSPRHSIEQLPGALGKPLKALIETEGLTELEDLPDAMLNARQLRVKKAALSGKAYFDKKAAAQALEQYKLPAWFMDFETIQFAVPIWKGTRPYQQIPFQFSVHRLSRSGALQHESFLDLTGNDPSLGFAERLLVVCRGRGPIFSYNASFERSRILELAARFPRMAAELEALAERIVDLLPVARDHYYHPSQQGSWSIKSVLPALCPDLDYAALGGVQNGGMAMEAYLEALDPATTTERRAEIERQLIAYCGLDTLALVRLWSAFSGSKLGET